MHNTEIIPVLIFILLGATIAFSSANAIEVFDRAKSGAFPIASATPTDIIVDRNDAKVVEISANLFAEDVKRVTGQKPNVRDDMPSLADNIIVIGTIGKNSVIDTLIHTKKLDVSTIQNQWESFTIAVVERPVKGVGKALIIAGSDRRGTAYGVFTISEAIGVSPWYYWADVPTRKMNQIHISFKTIVQGPPSVKYRGIFINDEDWGLQPWAARHLDTNIKDLGPNTYAKIFELLLRLKANYIWPGMHPCTQAFNIYPENKIVADNYAIVMGSSHCEPMLRNNVTEWDKAAMGEWDYETNKEKIYQYWEDRIKSNGQYENVYTVGMRGIHDSGIPGGGSDLEKRARLERIIDDQRKILSKYGNSDPSQTPQLFCPYKEVLRIYQLGLNLPDDVTIIWPDDNHGYIRNLSTPAERQRSGSSGIYYHLSYWGRPQDYLWISSTSLARISYEMSKAYAYGADRLWIFNVGDIKPTELEMEFALRLAYDIDSWPVERAMDFIEQWQAGNFGDQYARDIAEIQKVYYRLAQEARPEHIDRVPFSEQEQNRRLAEYQAITDRAEEIHAQLPPEYRDAFFQLVLYPVKAADLMNQKQTYAQQGQADLAIKAYDEIQHITRRYNKEIAGGKWDGIMDASPRKLKVFNRPDDANRGTSADANYMNKLDFMQADYVAPMQLRETLIVATAETRQTEESGGKATFVFNEAEPRNADLYFLAQCFDDNHDSWFVELNDQKVVSNDQPTGARFQWLKVMNVELKQGRNELTIAQREPGTVIKQIVLVNAGNVPQLDASPATVIPAAEYSEFKDTASSKWQKVEGLGLEKHAMILLPYAAGSISANDIASAPSITYSFEAVSAQCEIEARFLPTHQINDGMQLRYAISVDDGPAQIRNINAPESSSTWSQNVLQGFSSANTIHALNQKNDRHPVTIRFLDPGMVLSQIRITEL
ncbi:glycosyl hydrolase 115 family protein [Candidatus Sumerlaeota bacterium]|nr:glycosyl hydrolase 115 family protein [Candidatus Sumerlaeota bacterium]